MTRCELTPISAADSGSWATARMPRPSRVRLTNWSRATIMTIAPTDDEHVDVGDRVVADR